MEKNIYARIVIFHFLSHMFLKCLIPQCIIFYSEKVLEINIYYYAFPIFA